MHRALHNADTVKVFEDMHCCQVAANDVLDLGGVVLTVLEGVVGESSMEGRLDLGGGPCSNFKVAFGEPPAHELVR